MSYRDIDESESKGGIGRKLLGWLAVFAGFFLAKFVVTYAMEYSSQKSATPQSVEQKLMSDPNFVAYTEPLKQHFPEDYAKLLSDLAEMVRTGASQQDIAGKAFSSSRQFVKAHMSDIAAAPTSTLVGIASSHAELSNALAEASVPACAQFGFEGLNSGTMQQLPKSMLEKFREPARMMIIAAHEGRSGKGARSAELSDKDGEALVTALGSQGLSERQLNTFFSDEAKNAAPPEKCKMTVALYNGVAAMSAEQSARVTAALLLSST